jgi:hypothetical protein
MPTGLQEVETLRLDSQISRQLAQEGDKVVNPQIITERHQGYGAAGNEPATFSFVPQRLNQLSHRMPRQSIILCGTLYNILDLLILTFPHGSTGFLILEVSKSHSDTTHSVGLLWRVIGSSQRPLPDKTQN